MLFNVKFLWALRFFLYCLIKFELRIDSYIGRPCFVMGWKRVSIGKKFRCFPGARVEVHDNGILIIKNNVAIAQNVHITCGNKIEISSGVCIAPNVCVTDIKHNYTDIGKNILEQDDSYSETLIGKNCFLGYGAVIDHGVILGEGCIVSANSYVSKGDYPAYSIIAGNPAKVVKSYG